MCLRSLSATVSPWYLNQCNSDWYFSIPSLAVLSPRHVPEEPERHSQRLARALPGISTLQVGPSIQTNVQLLKSFTV